MYIACPAGFFRSFFVMLFVMFSSAFAQAQPVSNHGQVFILSGLMGELLSPGLEGLAEKIRRRGIPVTLASHTTYSARAGEAAAEWRAGNHGAIVIIGHSLGAASAMQMAREMKDQNIPVRLIVSMAPTTDLEAPGNVTAVINYFQSNSISKGKVTRSADFHGTISNIDLENAADTNHFNMMQRERVQSETVSRVFSLVSVRKAPQATPVQTSAVPDQEAVQHGAN